MGDMRNKKGKKDFSFYNIKWLITDVGVFLGLLSFSILFLFICIIPHNFPNLSEITKAVLKSEMFSLFLALLVMSIFIITFMLCVKVIRRAKKMMEESECTAFAEIDCCCKACNSLIYGYNVPIATINDYYSANGEIIKLIEEQGISPLLSRRKQLVFRSEFLGDAITCISSLMLSFVAAYITGSTIQNQISVIPLFAVVVIGISVATLFLRPVLAEKIYSKFDDDIRRYEIQKIDQIVLAYNQKLNIRNIDHCGERNRLSEIKKWQQELCMTKGKSEKKKIRDIIEKLEAGGEIPDKEIRDTRKEKNSIYEKYKTASWFYILIISVCVVVRFVPISSGSAYLDNVINDFAVGAAASTLVTLLLAKWDCSQKNKALARKKEMVFAEYLSAISDLRLFATRRCKMFCQKDDQLTFGEWLEKLSDLANYPKSPSPAVTVNRTYLHIASYVRNVKSTLIVLRQQYCLLVESDIVDTDDLRQHITFQMNLCDDICDTLEIGEYELSAITMANEYLVKLEADFRTFFENSIEEKYSYSGKG